MGAGFFPARRLGHVTSNIAESENVWLEEARHEDLVNLFMTYIWKLNALLEERRNEYARMAPDRLPKRVFKLLEESAVKARGAGSPTHRPTLRGAAPQRPAGVPCGQPRRQDLHVRLPKRAWRSLSPYVRRGPLAERRPEAVHCPRTATRCSRGDLRRIGPACRFEPPSQRRVVAPTVTKRRGRSKKNRIPSAAEVRSKRTVTCSWCHAPGHNSRSCKVQSN